MISGYTTHTNIAIEQIMNKHRMMLNAFFVVLCTLILYKPAFAEPTNLGLLKHQIQYYHDAGIYQKELIQVITNADRFILNTAKSNAKNPHPHKLAIVLDIDETSLSNYNHMVEHDFSATPQQFHTYIQAADANAITPMLHLYNDAKQHQVAIFFVTGRSESERHATEQNLKKAGYQDWAHLYHKPNSYNRPSIIPFKSGTRKAIADKGYVIIATIGDQWSDLKGGYAQKTFKLPNPYYYLP